MAAASNATNDCPKSDRIPTELPNSIHGRLLQNYYSCSFVSKATSATVHNPPSVDKNQRLPTLPSHRANTQKYTGMFRLVCRDAECTIRRFTRQYPYIGNDRIINSSIDPEIQTKPRASPDPRSSSVASGNRSKKKQQSLFVKRQDLRRIQPAPGFRRKRREGTALLCNLVA